MSRFSSSAGRTRPAVVAWVLASLLAAPALAHAQAIRGTNPMLEGPRTVASAPDRPLAPSGDNEERARQDSNLRPSVP